MKLLASSLFILTLSVVAAKKGCVLNKMNESSLWEEKIIKHVMCGYHPRMPPNDNPVLINVGMKVLRFAFDPDQQIFTLFTAMDFFWKDSRLEWNASEFGGVEDVPIQGYKLWTPYIRVLNGPSDLTGAEPLTDLECRLLGVFGTVMCFSKVIIKVKCGLDVRDWPYDGSKCALALGMNADPGVNISIPRVPDVYFETSISGGWNIVECKSQNMTDHVKVKFVRLDVLFHLTRRGEVTASIIIYPAITLSAVTLLSLFLDIRENLRLGLVIFSLMCHFYFLNEIGQQVPRGTDSIPNILVYYRGSVIMTFLSTALTLLFNLCDKKSVPKWVVTSNQYIASCFLKYFVFSKTKYVNEWTDLLNFINSVWIFVCVVIYVILYFVLVPKPSELVPVRAEDAIQFFDEIMNA